MSILKSFKDKLALIDLFGSKIDLKHKGHNQIKSIIGGLLTCGIFIFFIYITFYIGEDIIYKEKPISRVNKEYNETTKVTLGEYPYTFYFFDPVKNIKYANADKYFTMSALWYLLNLEGPLTTIYPLFVEQCTTKHVAGHETDFITNPDFQYTWCINPAKYRNGTSIVEKDVYVLNEYASIGSAFVVIRVDNCVNSTANGNSCAPQSQIDTVRHSLSFGSYFMDSYINLNEYENPGNMFLNRMVFDAPTSVQKRAFHRVRNVYIHTDSGIMFEDERTIPMLQVESMTADVVSRDYFFSVILEGNRIKDIYYRRYIKVQDIMAYAGGLFKFILLLGNFIFLYCMRKDSKLKYLTNTLQS
jgi:hypothetical protein